MPAVGWGVKDYQGSAFDPDNVVNFGLVQVRSPIADILVARIIRVEA